MLLLALAITCGIFAATTFSQPYSKPYTQNYQQSRPYGYSARNNATNARGIHYCGVPNVVPSQNTYPERYLGVWYTYRNTDPSVNMLLTYNNIGNSWDLLTDRRAVSMWVTEVYHKTNTTDACDYFLWIGQVVDYGVLQGLLWTSESPDYFVNDLYFTLYIDYDNLMIKYKCRNANHRNGVCRDPVFLINTRVRWDKLDAATLANFDRIIDSILVQFCLYADDIPRQIQGANLRDCAPISLPQSAAQYIKGLNITSDPTFYY